MMHGGDRVLALAVGISILLHGALLSVRFTFPDAMRWTPERQPLEVVLVNAKTRERPARPQVLAQSNLDRGGNVIVRLIDAPHSLVLGPPHGLSDGDATWSIVLRPLGNQTRLVSRVRARFAPRLRSTLLYAVVDPGQFVMERKWLLGIKSRAEAWAKGH